ncbi:MAG TPA: GntR family transcriptional regulator [Stellaceae bacterium]|nr:GntR family transcriptional regulator [Stellaceae bacterium]
MKDTLPEFDLVLTRTRRAQVAELLRDAIFSGKIAPGTQLVEMKLARRLGVSRGSVREAILELVEQGLLVSKPYAGTFVTRIEEKALSELFSLRKVLDRYAFTLLWPHRDEAYRAEFTARNRAIAEAMETGQRTAAIKAEMHFHSYPYEFCGDGMLLEVWQQLAHRIQLCFTVSQTVVFGLPFTKENQRYLSGALGNNLAAMLAQIDRHLDLGFEAVQRALKSSAQETRETEAAGVQARPRRSARSGERRIAASD